MLFRGGLNMTQVRIAERIKLEKRKKSLKYIRWHWQLYLLLSIPIILVIIFNYIPIYGIIIAFKNYKVSKGIIGSSWVGFKYFRQFFSSPSSIQIIRNTITISLYSILASIPFPVLLAIFLNEMRNKYFKKTVQMVTYAPYFISTVVLVSMVMQFLDPRIGIINKIISMIGFEPKPFMAIEQYFTHIYVWSGIWQGTGYGAIIYLAALSGINPELYEAATIDGANKWQKILYIDIPSILPTVTIMLILNFGQVMNVGFEKTYLMQNAANMNASEVISTYVYKIGLINMNMSFSTAVNLFNSGVNLIMILLVNYIANKLSETSLF
jgi:putative aldouronate transport system permease protein